MSKQLLWPSVLLLAALAGGCGPADGTRGNVYSGTIEMREHSVGAPVAGRIAQMLTDEGRQVHKGDLLAVLEHFEQAKRDFDRAQSLVASGGVSQEELEHDRQAMEDERVVSPVDGVVLVRVREAGEVTSAGAPVLIIGEAGQTWVRVFVPEDQVGHITYNQKARIHIDGIKQAFAGHVSFISPKAEFTPRNVQTPEERTTQTFAVKVMFDDQKANVRPGTSADVYFDAEKHG